MQIILKDSDLHKRKPTDEEVAYEMASKQSAAFAKIIHETWVKLGCPDTFIGDEIGKKMLQQIWRVWKFAYPQQYADHTFLRRAELSSEKSKEELCKNIGYTPISYPTKVYHIIKTVFPNVNISDKTAIKHLIQAIPELVVTNLKI